VLIDELFARGVMTMGASRSDPARQVGVFHPDYVSALPALRAAEMEKFRWLAGEWNYENEVPAGRRSPAYTDVGCSKFSLCDKNNWICSVAPDGRQSPQITFDPFSRQWIYLLIEGSYGILRSADGWIADTVVFSGLMTMVGINCEWRMTWTKKGSDQFSFVNEEATRDGTWNYIDQWRFQRKP